MCHAAQVKRLIATIDNTFEQLDQLLKKMRQQIARAAEFVHVEAENTSKRVGPRKPRRKAAKGR